MAQNGNVYIPTDIKGQRSFEVEYGYANSKCKIFDYDRINTFELSAFICGNEQIQLANTKDLEYNFTTGVEPMTITITNQTLHETFKSNDTRCPVVSFGVFGSAQGGILITGSDKIQMDSYTGNLNIFNKGDISVKIEAYIIARTASAVTASKRVVLNYIKLEKIEAFVPVFQINKTDVTTKENVTISLKNDTNLN